MRYVVLGFDFFRLPLALASGEDLLKDIGFSRMVWLKPISFVYI
jgi:hypothetical protein